MAQHEGMFVRKGNRVLKRLTIAAFAVGVSACSAQSSEDAVPTVAGSNASVVVLVDCGDDGVASVHVKYGLTDNQALIGRNAATLRAGGSKTFSSKYGVSGSDGADLVVTTSPTAGTCKTTLTDYNTGKVIAERETAGKVTLKVVIKAK
jgi:hypothetical protein